MNYEVVYFFHNGHLALCELWNFAPLREKMNLLQSKHYGIWQMSIDTINFRSWYFHKYCSGGKFCPPLVLPWWQIFTISRWFLHNRRFLRRKVYRQFRRRSGLRSFSKFSVLSCIRWPWISGLQVFRWSCWCPFSDENPAIVSPDACFRNCRL